MYKKQRIDLLDFNIITGQFETFDYSNPKICHGGGKSGGGGTNTVTNNSAPPPQIMAAYTQALQNAQGASSQPLQQYGGPTVAGFTPDQLSAFGTIDQSQGAAQPFIQGAKNLIQQGTQPLWNGVQQFSPQNVNQYMSPYTGQVLNSAVAQQQNTDAQQQQALKGNAISSGAWGGDRAGVASAVLSGQQDLANNATNAGILNQGYSQGLGEFNTQQQAQLGANEANSYLNQQGAFGLANLGQEALGTQLTGANAQLQAGAQQQQLGQEALNVPYQNFLQQQAYPFQTSQYYANIAEGLGSNSGGTGTGSTTTSGPSVASQIGGGALGTAGIIGGTGGFGADGWLTTLFAKRGGRIQPKHYDSGGSVPGIPDLSVSFIPNTSPMRGSGPPKVQPPKAPTQDQPQQGMGNIGDIVKMLNSIKGGSSGGLGGNSTSADALSNADAGSGAAQMATSDGADAFMQDMPFAHGGRAFGTHRSTGGSVLPDILAVGGDILGSLYGDPGAGNQGVDLLNMLDGGKTGKPGFDDGGSVGGQTPTMAQAPTTNPLQQNKNSNYQNMTPEQLQEYILRLPIGSPQQQTATTILKQKRTMPNVGTQAQGGLGTQQQTPMFGGYADGGDIPDPDAGMSDREDELQNEVNAPQTGGMGTQQMTASAAPPPGAEEPKPNSRAPASANPWLALAQAGFAIAGGTSPYAAVNIGRGAMQGVENYGKQQQEADTVNEAADKLMQEAKAHKGQLAIEQQNADTQKQNALTMGGYRQDQASLERAKLAEMSQFHDAQLDQGKYTVGKDPITGAVTAFNTKTGQFITPPKDPNAASTQQQYVDPETGEVIGGAPSILPASQANRGITPTVYHQMATEDSAQRKAAMNNIPLADNILKTLDAMEPNFSKVDTGGYASQAERLGAKALNPNGQYNTSAANLDKGTYALANDLQKFQYTPGMRGSVLGLQTILNSKPGLDQPQQTNENITNEVRSRVTDYQLTQDIAQQWRQASPLKITDSNTYAVDEALKAIYPVQTVDPTTGAVTFNKNNAQKIKQLIPDAVQNPQKYIDMARSGSAVTEKSQPPSLPSWASGKSLQFSPSTGNYRDKTTGMVYDKNGNAVQ